MPRLTSTQRTPWEIRPAAERDIDFLVEADLLADGYTVNPAELAMSPVERLAHRKEISTFVRSANECAWIAENPDTGTRAGLVMARFRDRLNEPDDASNRFLFQCLDPRLFPADGRFCEVFQLWVHWAYRRQGIATRLKITLEEESKKRSIRMIYTHTERTNEAALELNRKLGYQEVRRGPMGDAVMKVSLVKWLD